MSVPYFSPDQVRSQAGEETPLPLHATGAAAQSKPSVGESRLAIATPREEIEAFCQRWGVLRLSIFGSALRADFSPQSDIDILVEFAPDQKVGLSFFSMERELSEILGRKVDLNTPNFLSPHFRNEVLSQAQIQYDAVQR